MSCQASWQSNFYPENEQASFNAVVIKRMVTCKFPFIDYVSNVIGIKWLVVGAFWFQACQRIRWEKWDITGWMGTQCDGRKMILTRNANMCFENRKWKNDANQFEDLFFVSFTLNSYASPNFVCVHTHTRTHTYSSITFQVSGVTTV